MALSEDGIYILCDEHVNGCKSRIKNHKWGKIKDGVDWFFSMDGEIEVCPDHLPDWHPRRKK